jgi:hypothetical protein
LGVTTIGFYLTKSGHRFAPEESELGSDWQAEAPAPP